MTDSLFDGKSWYGYSFWNTVNRLVIGTHFSSASICGLHKLPQEKPFLLVANHSSRFDGLVVQYILNRKANYMVSPNEMRGMQKPAVLSVGAFPANPRLDLVGYATRQLFRGEPVVVFPEGNIFYDGNLRRFKTGFAKIALRAYQEGLNVEIIPLGIHYSFTDSNMQQPQFTANIGESVMAGSFFPGCPNSVASHYRENLMELTALMQSRIKDLVEISKQGGTRETSRLLLPACQA